MSRDTGQIVASVAHLAAFHEHRRNVYALIADLLASPERWSRAPDRGAALHAPRSAGPQRSGRELAAVLAAARPETVRAENERVSTLFASILRCADGAHPSRATAATAAGLGPPADRLEEIRVLARLADRVVGAIASGDMVDAATLCGLQVRFLRDHAAPCLATLAGVLESSGLPLYSQLGRSLKWRLEDDLNLLANPEAPCCPPRP